MRGKAILVAMGDIDDEIIQRAKATQKAHSREWTKWGALAACLCIAVCGLLFYLYARENNGQSASTLPGASEIYPTVMVDGQLYEWRRGSAILLSGLPDNCEQYGTIIHVDGKTPENNNEFVSVFSVSGQIYTVSDNPDIVYLCLTTTWMEDTTVVFDKAS